ncbi:putative sterol carrier protein [Altererythrobacter atlanticus]|uniref:Uncharacterized protein n=1 Tax=Croceibacterium atlanticum TaxID=1267766 RepID=A0A0F7KNU5_9SPHN|nr:hypothetical protein [Croceibacterium atlanticum]AKH41234.1 hypothetical protein WYH_00168 [Croceibacterium atlanticum]MBB5732752.1 putative sterol carrier protein [Croceibacterium atlanticum]
MYTIDELTEKLQLALAHNPVGRSLLIDMGDEGVIRAEGLVVTNERQEAECTLKVSKANLDAILRGDLDMVEAANDGRIEVIDDPSAAIAMQPVLFAAWLDS